MIRTFYASLEAVISWLLLWLSFVHPSSRRRSQHLRVHVHLVSDLPTWRRRPCFSSFLNRRLAVAAKSPMRQTTYFSWAGKIVKVILAEPENTHNALQKFCTTTHIRVELCLPFRTLSLERVEGILSSQMMVIDQV